MSDVIYKEGKIVDWLGKEHRFIVCGVVYPVKNVVVANEHIKDDKETLFIDEHPAGDRHIRKAITIGVSVCNPIDTFNRKIGERIAYNKALCEKLPKHWMASDVERFINPTVVDALLTTEVKHIEEHPECVISGYEASKRRYEQKALAQKAYLELPAPAQQLVNAAVQGFDLNKLQSLADALSGEIPALPQLQSVEPSSNG